MYLSCASNARVRKQESANKKQKNMSKEGGLLKQKSTI